MLSKIIINNFLSLGFLNILTLENKNSWWYNEYIITKYKKNKGGYSHIKVSLKKYKIKEE